MMGGLLVVLGLVGEIGLGYALAVAILGRKTDASRIELAGLSLTLGVGGTAWASFIWSWTGGALDRSWSVTLAALSLAAAAAVAWVRRGGRPRPRKLGPGPEAGTREVQTRPASPGALDRLLLALIGAAFLFAAVQALLTPQRMWDERAIFGLKAKVLYLDHGVASSDLHNAAFVQGHPRYPLLLPLAEEHVYALLGGIDDRWPKIIGPMLYLGLVLSFAGGMARHFAATDALVFGLLLATCPSLMPYDLGFITLQADAPVAAFHGVSLVSLALWLQGEGPRRIILAAVAAALAMFTKDEGLALGAIDLAGLVALGLAARGGRAVPAALGFGLVPLGLMTPWFLHRRALPEMNEMHYFGRMKWAVIRTRIDLVPAILDHLLGRMFREWRTWGVQWWGVVVSLVARPRRAGRVVQLFMLWDIAGALAALVLAVLIAPADWRDHLGGSSQRFLIQIIPAGLIVLLGQFGQRREA